MAVASIEALDNEQYTMQDTMGNVQQVTMGMELVELYIAGYWVSAGDFLSHTSNNFGSWYRLQIN